MNMHAPILRDDFWCHTHTPEFGFWGEQREMLRRDMTYGEAIELTKRKWLFGGDFQDRISPIHETSHKVAEVAAIYNPLLRRLLPQVDDQGRLRPIGYNGFANIEDLVICFNKVLNSLVNPYLQPSVEAEKEYFFGLTAARARQGYVIIRDDTIRWAAAYMKQDSYTSLFEFKRSLCFDKYKLPEVEDEEAIRELIASRASSLKPEILLETEPLPKEVHEAFWDTAEPFVKFAIEAEIMRDETVLLSQKMRDLHVLIGGEEAAKYFHRCGVPEYKPNKKAAMEAAF